jgi:hypothetical protein
VTGGGSGTRIHMSVSIDPNDPAVADVRRLSDSPISLGDTSTDSQDALLVDLDGDGDLDLVVANGTAGNPQGNTVFLNDLVDGQANLIATGTPLGNQASHAVAAADLDGNGFPDLVFANGGPNEIFLNQGGGTFTQRPSLGASDSRGVAIADFDGDGLPDLVFANAGGANHAYRNLGSGNFSGPIVVDPEPAVAVRAVDFSGDGHPDVIFGRQSATAPASLSNPLFVNTSSPGSISFAGPVVSLGVSPTLEVVAADFSLDGTADIVALNATGTHQIFVGASNSTFTLHPQQFVSPAPTGSAAGDFNGDGRLDLALTGSGGIQVFLNDGLGNLGRGDVTPPTIQLNGQASVTLTVDDAYADAGSTATDAIDGNVTSRITVTNPVNTSVIGTYTVVYNATDLSGNKASPVTRTVVVQARGASGGGGGGSTEPLLILLLVLSGFLGRLLQQRTRNMATVGAPSWRDSSSEYDRGWKPLLPAVTAAIAIGGGMPLLQAVHASELSYTFLDFQSLNQTVDAAGVQSPVPLQTVSVATGDADGIAVAGSLAAGEKFYIAGSYRSSIVDVVGTVQSPLTSVTVNDEFDLTAGRLSLGYLHPIGETLELIAEVSYDTVNYDFGSLAGENFDLDDSGVGAQLGFRWNPMPALEIFAFGRHSSVGRANLSAGTLESDTTAHAGFRVYFFRDLGVGLEYESGPLETTTISMRFSFGNLPW